MTWSFRTSGDGFTILQRSALAALRAQVHRFLTLYSPGDEARSIWNGTIHHADRRDLNVLLEKEEIA